MKRTISLAVTVVALAGVLAACGSSDDGNGTTSGSMPAAAETTVSTAQVEGVGTVLVDADGMVLYTPDEEADGTIVCTGACSEIWTPLSAGAGTPTASEDAGALGVVRRPDGTRQVTAGDRPLYTFAEDGEGEVTGNGLTDSFGGRSFTWHAMLAGGTPATGNAGGTTTGESEGDAGGSYGGGY